MADLFHSHSRSARLDQVLADLLGRSPELQAASVVSFDGLPMASALPVGMDEDRVAAMSAALLSLGERAAENFGRGALSQVYVEGEEGTVFLISADDEAVLVAVGAKGAKIGLLMFEVRRSAASVAAALRADDAAALEAQHAEIAPAEPQQAETPEPAPAPAALVAYAEPAPDPVAEPEPLTAVAPAQPLYAEVVAYPEPEQPPLAPALHVVENVVDNVAEELQPEPAADERTLNGATWGDPVTGEPAREASAWMAYDQTGRDVATDLPPAEARGDLGGYERPEPGRWG
jgi:predicted regulator of Ras-like GTPase activity (Roadblock/LC7/MglB family)